MLHRPERDNLRAATASRCDDHHHAVAVATMQVTMVTVVAGAVVAM